MLPASRPGETRRLLFALTAGAALSLATACGGGGGQGSATADPTPMGPCEMALAPLTNEALTPERFEEANAGLDEAIERADQGAPQEALVAFFLLSHDITHDVDAPLREQDEGLAIRLCNAVLQLEGLVGGETDGESVSALARSVREALAEARAALGAEESPL